MRTWIVFVGLILAKVFLLARSQQCRRCDQIISGRNLAYSRALEIIQEEDYLDEDEFDEIEFRLPFVYFTKKTRLTRIYPLLVQLVKTTFLIPSLGLE